MKTVDYRTLENALRREATAEGYGDYIPRYIVDRVVGLGAKAVRNRLRDVPRIGNKAGTRYQLHRVALAFAEEPK